MEIARIEERKYTYEAVRMMAEWPRIEEAEGRGLVEMEHIRNAHMNAAAAVSPFCVTLVTSGSIMR